MEFKKLELSDISTVNSFLYKYAPNSANDYTAVGLFLWRDYLNDYIAIEEDSLFIYQIVDGRYLFYYPLCENADEGLNRIIAYCDQHDLSFGFYPFSDSDLALLDNKNLDYSVEQKDDYNDYLYLIEDLANFNGKRFHSHKNHVNKFNKTYSDYTLSKITKENLGDIYSFISTYESTKDEENISEVEKEELRKLPEVLENLDKYNLFGYCLMVNGTVEGFELGEIVGDMYYAHIEKANRKIDGIYSKMINMIAAELQGKAVYMNREEDLGEAGLRAAKSRLHPCGFIKKNMVFVS